MAVTASGDTEPGQSVETTNGQNQGVQLPPRPPMSASPPRILIIGAGSRGLAYGRAILSSCNGIITAVAEPHDYKRTRYGQTMIWGPSGCPAEGAEFRDWHEFIVYEKQRRERARRGDADVPPGVDAAFVCVLDEMHREVVIALADLGGLHIMCEKPLATTLTDCVDMFRALRNNTNDKGEQMVFSIGHVLRYSPHNMMLRKLLLQDRVIGDVLSVVHTEPVGWWHFTHSYVRGNWRKESTTAPSLLTKSCHDIDVLLWLLCSPPTYTSSESESGPPPHLPSSISSTGSLQYFKANRKPAAAGAATNCLSCPIEESCKYSAKRVYISGKLEGLGSGNMQWPVSIVVPDIEAAGEGAEAALLSKLAEDYDNTTPKAEVAARNWFGRCVYESDNDVVDEQVVTLTWDEDPLQNSDATAAATAASKDPMAGRGAKTATFHMVAHTKKVSHRYTHLYGVDGEIYADSATITVEDFNTGETTTYHPRLETLGHGGGDVGLARQFVLGVDMVKNHGWRTAKAQNELIGCTLEEVIRSHAMVFCAEEARKGKSVVDWSEWWTREVEAKLKTV